MTVKERIKIFVQSEKMTISAFEKAINCSNGYVNSISKSIGIDKLENILEKFPNLNIEWLLTGSGVMLKDFENYNYDFKSNIVNEPAVPILKNECEKLLECEKEINLLLRDKIATLQETNENLKKELEHYEPGPDVSQSSEKLKK